MAKKKLHPLEYWIISGTLSLHAFARENDIPFRALYRHILGQVRSPKIETMMAIERGTGGVVTVRRQVNWFQARHK